MFKTLGRFSSHLLTALVMLAALLVALWFVLNVLATHTPAPISTAASTVEGLASGSAYGI